MKYYLKKNLEELAQLQKKFPFIYIDYDSPSLALMERVPYGTCPTPSSIVLLAGIGPDKEEAVRAMMAKLDEIDWYEKVINELGDTCNISDLCKMFLDSGARTNSTTFPSVREVLAVKPEPEPAMPANAEF